MSAHSRRKGDRYELEVAKAFQAHNFDAVKNGCFVKDDLLVGIDGQDRIVECKRRKNGLGGLHGHIAGRWAVVHRADREENLITLRLNDFLALAGER